MTSEAFDPDWLRGFATYLDQIDPELFVPMVSVDETLAHALLWQYRRQDFVLSFGARRLWLPPVASLGEVGVSTNDCADPGIVEVPSLADAVALIHQVESVRQRTAYPHIRLGRLTTGLSVFHPPQRPGQSTDDAPAVDVGAFLAWVRQGIVSGELPRNSPEAFVHFVPEGMLLITPKVFREYLAAQGILSTSIVAGGPVKRLQKLLQKSGLVALASKQTYLHVYRVPGAKNPNRDRLTGYLVPNTAALFNPVPEINTLLERVR
jgi:hypothetical protein